MKNYAFKIVGIGASAGGLEALDEFFRHIPKDSGLAFVVIQHLDPSRKCILSELLQKVAPIPVCQIINNTIVKPNHVYVIPPNKSLYIAKGQLKLNASIEDKGLRLPIDIFFNSLAEDSAENAVGMILSGMGADGMLGLLAIKQHGGLTLAQSPDLAKFNSMPLNAINANAVDIVSSAKQLAENITTYISSPQNQSQITLPFANLVDSKKSIDKIISLLFERSGNDFSLYKNSTVYRRIERRLTLHKINNIEHYAEFMAKNPQEVDLLFKEILIGVTNFFRDQDVWQQLIKEVIPALLSRYPSGQNFRAWVVACSTGEEAYSLAIAFQESIAINQIQAPYNLQVFATDINDVAINIARQGLYSKEIKKNVSPQILKKYFTYESSGYRIAQQIREMVIFAPQNIIVDPPFTRIDILTCRNLLIYLSQTLQKRIVPLLHYALNKKGILLLGNAETIGDFTDLFTQTQSGSRIYHRVTCRSQTASLDFPTRMFPTNMPNGANNLSVKNMDTQNANLQFLANNVLLENFTPAAVLINSDGDILYINGRTGKYLEPAAGKANWNIYAMARDSLRYEVDIAIRKAKKQKDAVRISNLVVNTNGQEQTVDLSVQAINEPEAIKNTLMIVFNDVPPLKTGEQRLKASKQGNQSIQELNQTREQIRLMREEMKTSQEELKAANEELQSTNEELQSTNEELTTSKEEMQSLNEELQTLNTELQSKVDDLTEVNNDMDNLLNSTEIATVFLDNQLKVRRFTTLANQLFKLIATDIGRPLSDIVTILDYENLENDAREVLRTLVFSEYQAITNTQKWFKVRTMPYRTHDNKIDGVVITFTDITQLKELEFTLEAIEDKDG